MAKKGKETIVSSSKGVGQADDYVPPTQNIKKYIYAKRDLVDRNYLKDIKKDKKLAHRLHSANATAKASAAKAYEHDDLLLDHSISGLMETENELERTWKVTQGEILRDSAIATASKSFDLEFENFGPYAVDYTRNGRHLAIAGRKGHVGTFDWMKNELHTELHLGETVRDIKWLHDESFFAVAQKKYVYIYDKDGLEVHQLKQHIEVTRMEFLPYHFLLATVGNPGFLKYQDTSTGQLVAEHRTKLGACRTMTQNLHNAFIHLGHQNGTVTLWSPSVSRAQVTLQAHRGPVTALAVDPSSQGQRMVSCGLDGTVKLWDTRKWDVLEEFAFKKTPQTASFSQKGLLALGWGNHLTVLSGRDTYMSHLFPATQVNDVRFCPYEDIVGVGHAKGFTSFVVPGAGEAHFDSLEADPFESKKRRQEREINMLLDKIPAELITLDENVVGRIDKSLATEKTTKAERQAAVNKYSKDATVPYARQSRYERLLHDGKVHEDEDISDVSEDDDPGSSKLAERKQLQEIKANAKKRARGRNSTLKKMLRKRQRNIVDPKTLEIKAKMEQKHKYIAKIREKAKRERSEQGAVDALDRFK